MMDTLAIKLAAETRTIADPEMPLIAGRACPPRRASYCDP